MGLLFDESPLVLSPTLAIELGNLNEAVFVQQLHYWLEIKKKTGKNYVEGRYWVYNSVEEWLKQFPWLSSATLRRTIDNLVKKGYVFKGNFNQKKMDHTIWYSLNYEKLMEIDKRLKAQKEEEAKLALDTSQSDGETETPETLVVQDISRIAQNEQIELSKSANRSAQNEQIELLKMSKSICSKRANRSAQNEQTNTIDYPYTNSKTTTTETTTGARARPPVEVEVARAKLQELNADAVLDLYNHCCPSFPEAIHLTQKRQEAISDLLSKGISMSQIQEAFRRAEQSDFLTGRVKRAEWKRFDFDWLIQLSSIVSLLEGKYDNVPVQKQKRIEKNQALFLQSTANSKKSEPLMHDKVEEYPTYLKDALKRHNCFPEKIQNQEARP